MNLNISPTDIFEPRHIGPNEADTKEMLKTIGVSSLDELIDQTVPANIRLEAPMKIGKAMSENEMINYIRGVALRNKVFRSFIGAGYYGTIVPQVIQRNILENPGWYTQYTPYQAEISQGRLEALLNYQTMIIDLTGMQIANASLLDEGTAAAEAMFMMYSANHEKKGNQFFISEEVFPQTIDVLKTRAVPLGIELVMGDHRTTKFGEKVFGALVQYPAGKGAIYDYSDFCAKAKANNVLVTVAADILALTILTPPGEFGADIVVGSAQRFGVPMGYGGPHAAFLATKDEYKRVMPGRIIGVSIDANGNKAYRMALQTREQHIRREKATSNICTAQVLLAIMAGMYGTYHGPEGLKKIAARVHGLAKVLDKGLKKLEFTQSNETYFDTLHIVTGNVTASILNRAVGAQMNFRQISETEIGISVDETTTVKEIETILSVFASVKNKVISVAELSKNLQLEWEKKFIRTSNFMLHPVFNSHHSEHEMLRYMHALEMKDLSLNFSMIPLGSCTMKLNATTEMLPVTMPEFGSLHPFTPREQAMGYSQIFEELSNDLKEITGFAGVSLQPNAGAQGEYTGLLVIRQYLKSKNELHRTIALIPSSAHGTNPASAVMAGFKVVVVKCDEQGNVEVGDLKTKAEEHKANLACLMVTYPSTHGVFEESIQEICSIIHKNGGQVYMDGANMNAQVGLTSPARIGADVCHLNLHKTFSIPHGGGGPGMGPICVAEHLVPFLPGHSVVPIGGEQSMSAVSSGPWGSASVLLISYMYIKMMGATGLTNATKYAILNANYIKSKLEKEFDVLYVGKNGRCAHEMIIDMRKFKASAGVEVTDIAKRLMDYGFHAPTVSFPVAGTLMIEPTESEPKGELDRFCDALFHIRKEIAEIEQGKFSKEDNVLHHAPHTASVVMSDEWKHSYSREKAAFPIPWVRAHKFWPSIGRINDTYGDRQLVCSCPPVESYTEHTI
ncbi:MAG: aminomethyl-transferring glycine dehydrogenase [Bacteriovoracaceae bacterium]|nr:aminomethyl-transferring glycine dehydrogenase [Bacteroidota bacterium]